MNFIKKHAIMLATTLSAVGSLIAVGLCHATDPFASISSAITIADITAYAGNLFTDLWVVIALVIGIPLAFYVIRKVVSLVRMH